MDDLVYSETPELPTNQLIALYRANNWSAAGKPEALHRALSHSDAVVSAWSGSSLIGLGNAITDTALVVYYPHCLVLPNYHGRGVGRAIMRRLMLRYQGFHQHILVADRNAVDFYKRLGFAPAGDAQAMWVFQGEEH